ncbi:dimethylallyltranstransferase [Prauserella sp. PE36]|uniref:Polyprenyl synthetase family protein n=1 Tax=Prauserella endophytica TaxID=1592324 RepID=A0ABY2S6T9_9PSEU|nr:MULTISPECIES: polyprenyl synthetase family protein [Prauserella]PXY30064.1 dimethylallyltranstransferase [Prauserella coralliicola]RBM12602.1 dimethylallyltranstransferase [Prauserella sp. PE36]TKG71126.1 polyprenyl synthetase family protein [Prauserella endophytica]
MTATLPSEVTATQALVQPALRDAVGELRPPMRRIVSYHLGWTDEHGQARNGGGGKALRPALALLAAQAVRAGPEAALPGAVAVELVHNFSLLHDDVMDGDLERRHRPTVWRLFGTPAAILAGDALLTLAVDVLERAADPTATRCLTASVQDLIAGQSQDVGFETRMDVGLDECLEMAAGKTAALMRCAAEVGALLGRASPVASGLLAEFGRCLGMAFQLVDDLLGIWGSPDVTGKPVLADLRVRKKSVPVVAALDSGTGPGAALRELYGRPDPPTEEELRTMAELIERSGALAWTRDRAQRYVVEARSCLDRLAPPEPIHAALSDLTRFVVERDR